MRTEFLSTARSFSLSWCLSVGFSALVVVLLGLPAPAVSGAPVPPDLVEEAASEIHQLRSTANRPYTLFRYTVPTAKAVPHILAVDDEDHVWFSQSGGRFAKNFIDAPPMSRIGRLDKNGTISEWLLKGEETSPMGIVFDAEGNLWISERLGNRITRRSPDGQLRSWEIPTPGAWPTGIAIDSKGRVWFTETKGDKLGMIDPATEKLVEYKIPGDKTMTTGIAIDHQDRVWIAERDINTIGLFDPETETFTQYPLSTPESKPCALVVTRDGSVWFSQRGGGKIGRIEDDGTIREYAVPDRYSGPFFLVADRRGDLWFSEIFSGDIGRFDPETEEFEHFEIPGEEIHPAGLALDSKGNVWIAEQSSNRISVIVRTDLSYLADEDPDARPTAVRDPDPHVFTEWEIPHAQAIPGIVGVDENDVVWFTEMGGGWIGPGFPPGPPGSHIGYIKDGVLHELETPTPEAGPTSMGLDPCSEDVWFTLRHANKIARVRDFEVTEYDVPLPDAYPIGIDVDLDHNVWVAFSEAAKLGRRSPDGEWRFLDLPDLTSEPRTIYVDPWNDVWFAEKTGNHVGWVDQENWTVERYEIPTKVAWPLSLLADDDGNLWFAQMRSDKLAMLDRETREITEYSLPVQSAPFKLLYDRDNSAMWISTVFYNAILRFDLDQRRLVGIYKVPQEGAWVGGLDRDSEKCIWFSQQFANRIGRLCIEGVSAQTAFQTPPADAETTVAGTATGTATSSTAGESRR